jgi:hypothetical protein
MEAKTDENHSAVAGQVERGVSRLLDEATNICTPPLALPETTAVE